MKRYAILLLILFSAADANADTLRLKNGGVVEGVIEKEDRDNIELNIGFGSATFRKYQIKSVERSAAEENNKMIKKWGEKKRELDAKTKEFEEAREKRFTGAYEHWMEDARQKKMEQGGEAKHINFTRDESTRSIIVEALLNEKVKANLVLDTGASIVVLSKNIGEELGVDMTDTKNDIMEFRLADGSRARAKAVILDNIRIQDVNADKVMAAVMLDRVSDPALKDGLLGMTFLSRFNIKMDLKEMKMILEKIEQ